MTTNDQKSEIAELLMRKLFGAFSKKASKQSLPSTHKGHKRKSPKK